ncbi:MAG: S1 RNA-binding domain-containing protein, partial [Halioglobus sp.]
MTSKNRIHIGRPNRMQVVKRSAHGLFLDGYDFGEILLPKRFSPDESVTGDWLDVFVYADS